MKLFELLVPTLMGDTNKKIKKKHHQKWDEFVRAISNGLTILKPALGQWVEPESNLLFREWMIPVRIACSSKQIKEIARFTIKHYKQKAVMYYQISNNVKIMEL